MKEIEDLIFALWVIRQKNLMNRQHGVDGLVGPSQRFRRARVGGRTRAKD
jgi:hypothetical protein